MLLQLLIFISAFKLFFVPSCLCLLSHRFIVEILSLSLSLKGKVFSLFMFYEFSNLEKRHVPLEVVIFDKWSLSSSWVGFFLMFIIKYSSLAFLFIYILFQVWSLYKGKDSCLYFGFCSKAFWLWEGMLYICYLIFHVCYFHAWRTALKKFHGEKSKWVLMSFAANDSIFAKRNGQSHFVC